MSTVYLVRHGRTTANARGLLAGRSRRAQLDAHGERQAKHAGVMLRQVDLEAIVTSPLPRTRRTAAIVRDQLPKSPRISTDEHLNECDYGDWSGRSLTELAEDPLWRVVQEHPSAVTFPGGESMVGMQHRAVAGIRALNRKYGAYVVVSHGDIIKALLADALGMHLDQFQRIVVDPGSVSVITYTALRPVVSGVNLTRTLKGIQAPSGHGVVGGRSR